MSVLRRITLASAPVALLSLLSATSCGSQGTVGVVGAACTASPTGDDPCGAGFACGADGRCVAAGFVMITPTAHPLGETSVALSWAAPAGPVAWYEVRVSTASGGALAPLPALGRLAPSATTAVVPGLAPGTLGHVVVAAAVPSSPSIAAPGALLWTPFGALNEDSVSSVTPIAGYAGTQYAEGMFVSSHFSMFYSHAFNKESSFVFDGMPTSSSARPLYNFASPVIRLANGFQYPDVTDFSQIWSDGSSKVLVTNDNQHRVLVYNHLPLAPDTATPDLLLGQSTWTGTSPDGGSSTPTASGLHDVAGACFNGTTLYVRDNGNNRILGWSQWPTRMGQPADFVLGQPDFVSWTPNNGGISKASLSLGAGTSIDCRGTRLVVADTGNSRVLVWNVAPTKSGVAADLVLGQTDGTLGDPSGAGGIAMGGMLEPVSAATLDGGGGRTALVVSDVTANRVDEWDDLPATDGAPFDRIFGQPDRTTTTPNTGGLSMGTMNEPATITVDDENRFWVADFANGRALRFALDSPAAIDLFGQRTGASAEFMPGSFTPTRWGWTHWTKGQFALDPSSGILVNGFWRIWSTAPADGSVSASAIQGQVDSVSSSQGQPVSATSIAGFVSAVALAGRVYWSDTGRILSKVGTFDADDSVPDVILGGSDFQGNPVGPQTLDRVIAPTFLATDGARLLATDGARIVGWNTAPVASHTAIDFALGQPSLLENTADSGGVTAQTLGGGRLSMTIDGGRLIVADPANHRVLLWNAVPSATNVAADVVLGQPSFTASTPGSSLAQMNAPSSVAVLDGRLLVSDSGNDRILVFDPVPTASGTAASRAWDPRTEHFSLPAWFETDTLAPNDIGAYGGRLYVGQLGRILVVPDIFGP
jgi:hypothetical protein